MTGRATTIHIPIWARIPGIIALVLIAVLLSTLLLGAASGGGGGRMDHNGDQTGGHIPPGGRGH